MAKRGGASRRSVRFGTEKYKKKMKKLFFTFLDSVILFSFSLSIYFIYYKDYTRTILFLTVGCLLLMFFIVRGIIKTSRNDFFE